MSKFAFNCQMVFLFMLFIYLFICLSFFLSFLLLKLFHYHFYLLIYHNLKCDVVNIKLG